MSDEREEVGEEILPILDKDFENSIVDIRAVLAIQLTGITIYPCMQNLVTLLFVVLILMILKEKNGSHKPFKYA